MVATTTAASKTRFKPKRDPATIFADLRRCRERLAGLAIAYPAEFVTSASAKGLTTYDCRGCGSDSYFDLDIAVIVRVAVIVSSEAEILRDCDDPMPGRVQTAAVINVAGEQLAGMGDPVLLGNLFQQEQLPADAEDRARAVSAKLLKLHSAGVLTVVNAERQQLPRHHVGRCIDLIRMLTREVEQFREKQGRGDSVHRKQQHALQGAA